MAAAERRDANDGKGADGLTGSRRNAMTTETSNKGGPEAASGNEESGYRLPPDALGPSVRIVGPVKPQDLYDSPHAKNGRRELGAPMYNWLHNPSGSDPFQRTISQSGVTDKRNVVGFAVHGLKGSVNPGRTTASPAVMTRHIKQVAAFMGAGQVGVASVHPSLLSVSGPSHGGDVEADHSRAQASDDPETLAARYPYAVCMLLAWDYHLTRAHRHILGDIAYGSGHQLGAILSANVAGYIRELGYEALDGKGNSIPMCLAAGLGELGRNGMLIAERFGARVHPFVLLTDMPLVPDKPIDIGVDEFCRVCNKCAETCPTNSIPFGDKTVSNGVEKYHVNWKTCYALRPYMSKIWRLCLTCVAVCPYTKPDVWWRSMAIWLLRTTPKTLRIPLVVRPLKWLDDHVWGRVPRPRVKWLGYDTGRLPSEPGCNIAGCSCRAGEHIEGNIGYYAPLTENARRFDGAKSGTARGAERVKATQASPRSRE